MKTLTVRLPADLVREIERESEARHVSKSDVVRERLRRLPRGVPAGPRRDACLVRLTETLAEPVIVTTDSDFRIYRRHTRHVVPCLLP